MKLCNCALNICFDIDYVQRSTKEDNLRFCVLWDVQCALLFSSMCLSVCVCVLYSC
jgi:hypothetical protein